MKTHSPVGSTLAVRDVFHEFRFGAGRLQRGGDDRAGHHVEAGGQRVGAVTRVLDLANPDLCRLPWRLSPPCLTIEVWEEYTNSRLPGTQFQFCGTKLPGPPRQASNPANRSRGPCPRYRFVRPFSRRHKPATHRGLSFRRSAKIARTSKPYSAASCSRVRWIIRHDGVFPHDLRLP